MEANRKGPTDPRRVWLDEKDCERLNRHEFEAVRCLLGAVSYVGHATDDLQKRLECIPAGKQRMAMARGQIAAIANDIIGTMTQAQCRQMQGIMNDMEIRMVPKMTPSRTNVVMTKENAMNLVDCSKAKCALCAAEGDEIRQCRLYKTFEAIIPLESYGDGLLCPYALAEWED